MGPRGLLVVMSSMCVVFSVSKTVQIQMAMMSALEKTPAEQTVDQMVTIDGNKDQTFSSSACAKTKLMRNPYWNGYLSGIVSVSGISIWIPNDCCGSLFRNVTVRVGLIQTHPDGSEQCFWFQNVAQTVFHVPCQRPIIGDYVEILVHDPKETSLALCEVEITTGPPVIDVTTLSAENVGPSTEISSTACACSCVGNGTSINTAELNLRLGELKKSLKVSKRSLTSYQIKITSAPYKSTFSTAAGSVAIGVFVAVGAIIVAFDLSNIRVLRSCF